MTTIRPLSMRTQEREARSWSRKASTLQQGILKTSTAQFLTVIVSRRCGTLPHRYSILSSNATLHQINGREGRERRIYSTSMRCTLISQNSGSAKDIGRHYDSVRKCIRAGIQTTSVNWPRRCWKSMSLGLERKMDYGNELLPLEQRPHNHPRSRRPGLLFVPHLLVFSVRRRLQLSVSLLQMTLKM